MRLNADYNNYVPPNTASKVLHTGPGKIHAILLTSSSYAAPETLTLYDNTAASGSVLTKIYVSPYAPVVLHFDKMLPLVFATGLVAVTTANAAAFLITEA